MMKKMNTTFLITLTTLIIAGIHTAEADVSDSDIVGKKEFITYCASCHGSNGKGDGPIVHFLKRKPADLTQLSKNNDDIFPFDQVYGVFDGTYQFDEHGTSEMPIWGYQFIREAQKDNEPNNAAKAKALNIILYIQIIQE